MFYNPIDLPLKNLQLKTAVAHIKLFQNLKISLELATLPHFQNNFEERCFFCYILLIDQISFSGCLNFVRYWAICVLELFVNQVVRSWILKLTLSL